MLPMYDIEISRNVELPWKTIFSPEGTLVFELYTSYLHQTCSDILALNPQNYKCIPHLVSEILADKVGYPPPQKTPIYPTYLHANI